MPEEGVEPSRPEGHMALNHACLPIPAPGRDRSCKYQLSMLNMSFTNDKKSLLINKAIDLHFMLKLDTYEKNIYNIYLIHIFATINRFKEVVFLF